MIGTTRATTLFLIDVLVASVLGVGVGGLTCLVLRRPWGMKTALIDAALAAGIVAMAAYGVSAAQAARGVWESGAALIMALAIAGVAVRHLRGLLEIQSRTP